MRAMVLRRPRPIGERPLEVADVDRPAPGAHEVRVRVLACGVCHTDLHIAEGDLPLPRLPLIPGHQVVGHIDSLGGAASDLAIGDLVGVPWLHSTCGSCRYCMEGSENLCDAPKFTGYDVDGGYAEYLVAPEASAYPLPASFGGAEATSLLCGGVIGYRALRVCELRPGERLGLVGFGNSAHVTLQIAKHWGCRTCVFTRGEEHQRLALELGADWVGSIGDDPGRLLDRAIIFAPAGGLVPATLRWLRKGGTLALAGITMTPIPSMDYSLLYGERTVRSVANSTHQDVRELLRLAAEIPIRTEVATFPLEAANEALLRMKESELRGGAALLL